MDKIFFVLSLSFFLFCVVVVVVFLLLSVDRISAVYTTRKNVDMLYTYLYVFFFGHSHRDESSNASKRVHKKSINKSSDGGEKKKKKEKYRSFVRSFAYRSELLIGYNNYWFTSKQISK